MGKPMRYNGNNDYTALDIVNGLHNVPHLTKSLSKVSNDFNIDYTMLSSIKTMYNSYIVYTIPIPAIVTIIALLAIIILPIALLCRKNFCGARCRCMNNESNLTPDGDVQHRLSLRVAYISFAIVTIILIQFILLGSYQYFSSGVNLMINSVNNIAATNSDITNNLNQLEVEGLLLQKDFTLSSNSQCNLESFNTYLNEYYFPDLALASSLIPPTSTFTDASNAIDYYGNTVRIFTVWGFYVVIMLITLFYSLFLYLEYKKTIKCLIALVESILLILFILCGIQFVSLIIYADFCVTPSQNVLKIIDPNTVGYNVTYFYETCEGPNPLAAYVVPAELSIVYLENQLVNLQSSVPVCQNSTYLSLAIFQVNMIAENFASLNQQIQCQNIHSDVVSLQNNGLCSQTFLGYYIIWLIEYLSLCFLYVLTVLASILMQHFGRYELVQQMNQHIQEGQLEEINEDDNNYNNNIEMSNKDNGDIENLYLSSKKGSTRAAATTTTTADDEDAIRYSYDSRKAKKLRTIIKEDSAKNNNNNANYEYDQDKAANLREMMKGASTKSSK